MENKVKNDSQILDLSGFGIRYGRISQVTRMIKRNKKLRIVNLDYNKLGDKGVDTVC